jgi:predicted PurR-regulated permease PerM
VSPSTPSASPGHWRAIFYVACTLFVLVVVVAASDIMLPFVLAPVVAYVLTPVVAWLERKRFSRALAIVSIYVVLLGVIAGGVALAAPRVVGEVRGLRKELPEIGRHVQTELVPKVQAQLRGWGLSQPSAPLEADDADKPALSIKDNPEGGLDVEVRGGVAVHPDRHGGFVVEAHRDEIRQGFDLNLAVASTVQRATDYVKLNALEVVKTGTGLVRGISKVIFVFSITLMLAAYIMLTREKIFGFFRSLSRPAVREDFDALITRMDRGLSGVVRGQLVICLVNGVLTAIGFGIAQIKYWPVLALIATVFSLIPIFGAIISSVPAVVLALTQSPAKAVFVLGWIIGIHQLEANFLNPKIMGDAAKIHPVLVVFSLLLGEHFFKTTGALLAVPCMSLAQSLFLHVRERLEARDPAFADAADGLSAPAPPELITASAQEVLDANTSAANAVDSASTRPAEPQS